MQVTDEMIEAAVEEIRKAKHQGFDRWTDQKAMGAALEAAWQVIDVEGIREAKLDTIAPPDNGTVEEVLSAVLACANAWVPEARIIGNVRAGDIARVIAPIVASGGGV